MMANQQIIEGRWNELKGKLREKWGQLSDSDLPQFQGNVDQLVSIIQQRTGESREAIEDYLNQFTESAGSMMGKANAAIRNYAQRTTSTFQGTAQQAADQVRGGYIQAERVVRNRPAESLAVCFGIGLVIGVLVALSLRSK